MICYDLLLRNKTFSKHIQARRGRNYVNNGTVQIIQKASACLGIRGRWESLVSVKRVSKSNRRNQKAG